jgi:hypothetical protein
LKYLDEDKIMLKENITNHDINEVHHSFQSFSFECFAASNNLEKFHQKLNNSQ